MKIIGSSEKPPTAQERGYEKPRGAERSAEKAGATEGIQSAGEGGSLLKSARARKDFQNHQKSFFKVFLLKFFLGYVWGSFRGVKTYSEQKRLLGKNF